MVDSQIRLEQILNAIEPINDYFKNDMGGIKFVKFSERNILILRISGSCSKCRKNNKYLKFVIKEMINEVVNGTIEKIKYI